MQTNLLCLVIIQVVAGEVTHIVDMLPVLDAVNISIHLCTLYRILHCLLQIRKESYAHPRSVHGGGCPLFSQSPRKVGHWLKVAGKTGKTGQEEKNILG